MATKKASTVGATDGTAKINPALEVLARPVDSLKLDERNARKHERRSIDAIKTSLATYGQQKPIVALTSGVVIAGNGTLEAARELGWNRLAVVTFDNENEARARAFAIMDNRSAELSSWNDDELISSVGSIPSDLISSIGFSEIEIGKMLTRSRAVDDDDTVEPTTNDTAVNSKIGESYALGGHVLICGDSSSADAWSMVQQLSRGHTKSVITSPPYGTNTNMTGHLAENAGKSFYNSTENVDDWHRMMIDFTKHAMTECDQLVVNLQMLADNKRSMVRWCHEYIDHLVDVAIWSKRVASPALAERVMDSAFEFVFVLSKSKNASRAIPLASNWRGKFRNVFEVSHGLNEFADVHRAVFSIEFVSHLINMTTSSDVVVVDPFGGTGTTMIACETMKRKSVLIEIDPKYCDVIRRRWTKHADEHGIDAGSGCLR